MNKELVIVFVKNIKLGKVKTRLAKTIGNQGAFEVYSELVKVTENATKNLTADLRIYFSDAVVETKWQNTLKTVQQGANLGERMLNAFKSGFNDGYERIVLIGSDLPDITEKHINEGLEKLKKTSIVFGPAEDGGYYLVGLSKSQFFIFENKPWSQPHLLQETITELDNKNIKFDTLTTLNDIDTWKDLVTSTFYKQNTILQEKINSLSN
ncbi:TIGR04282 family arsenosugar biosynthesis glycosyltransferase [uncultured Algibacter sp.]|uniref:TIGR04282 family arsenosugar biosynthesis glycosyltransferase n=1 Tax=uncultured Algibacter sp. TaxID=298659 RepID=UPI0026016562|nr:TIGR04282 family arsenosugar biosynthesis glycosyltransferase [uncultured Algibacter sp.]